MRVLFLVKGDPFSWRCHEALRVALALGINHEVFLVFLKDGVYALTKWKHEKLLIHGFEKLLENMGYVNVKLFVEDLSAEERGLKKEDFAVDVGFVNMESVKDMLASSEAVLVW